MMNWEQQDPKRTERGIQMLLRRVYPGLRSYDGAGGDGGQDAALVTADGRIVFEVKSFGRLTSSRRSQVERSLRQAVVSAPAMTRWVVVLPMNMTPKRPAVRSSEEAWFEDQLPKCAPGVELEWWGQDWLDTQLAESADVQRYIEGTDAQLLQRAKEFNLEQAALTGGPADLNDRLSTLRRRVDEVSMFWTLDFFVQDGIQSTALRAKTPDSPTLDPITITPTVAFRADDPEDQALRQRLERTLAFGGSVELPAGYVTEIDIDASPEARLLLPDADPKSSEFAFQTVREVLERSLRCHFQVFSADERVLAQFPVYLRERTAGSKGVTFYGGDAAGIVKFEVNIPRPETVPLSPGPVTLEGAGLHFDMPESLVGCDVASLLPIISTLAAASTGTHLRFEFPQFGFIHGTPLDDEARFPQAPETSQFLYDLHRMEQHTGSVLRFPANLKTADVADLRTFVRTLDGEEVEYEGGLDLDLDRDGATQLLATMQGNPEAAMAGGFLGAIDGIKLKVGDLELDYGVAALWAPHPRLTNLEQIQTYVESGDPAAPEVKAHFEPTDALFRWVSRQRAEEYFQSGTLSKDGSPLPPQQA